MKTNLKTFPDSRNFEPKDSDEEGYFDDAKYEQAISDWVNSLKKELKAKLEEVQQKEFGVGHWPYEYGKNHGRQEIIKELLGLQSSESHESTPEAKP